MRQTGAEQTQFREVLDRLADCASTEQDFQYLKRRQLEPDPPIQDENLRETHKKNFAKFENSIRIFFTNAEVNAYNKKMLGNLNKPLCLIRLKTLIQTEPKKLIHLTT